MTRASVAPFAKRLMTDRATIVRPHHISNGRGGYINDTAGAVIYDGPCVVRQPERPTEGEDNPRETGRTRADFYFPLDLPFIKLTDVIHWNSSEWEVIGHPSPTTHRTTVRINAWRSE